MVLALVSSVLQVCAEENESNVSFITTADIVGVHDRRNN